MDHEARKAAGAKINEAKEALTAALDARRAELENEHLAAQLASDTVDVTLPGRGQNLGGLHPVTRSRRRIEQIFRGGGFTVADGPEIEDDWHNFEALNIAADHPARAMHDTSISATGGYARIRRRCRCAICRRTSHRAHHRARPRPPSDSDMTHTPMFHQLEGLVVDEGINFANLKAVLHGFMKSSSRRTSACGCVPRTSRSPSRRPSTFRA